mmetsp:Transcript_49663/g.142060  ORF Transcript_49663/g.142060 Transcript_49663/m.142060 type:complete len:550 (+) Transcript_49663:34-1683(+)
MWVAAGRMPAHRSVAVAIVLAARSCAGLHVDPPKIDLCKSPGAQLFQEPGRPQFHFTPTTSYLGEPAGLVYNKGIYHFFFQCNPRKRVPVNATWCHATSLDLLHWTRKPEALRPDELGDPGAGSAVIDWHNSLGLPSHGEGDGTIVAFYSNRARGIRPFTQRMAYSTDQGHTWSRPEGSVVGIRPGAPRSKSPKVIYDASNDKWLMLVSAFTQKDTAIFNLYSSSDLQAWTALQEVKIDGMDAESPDFFQLPVLGALSPLWVLTSGNGAYVVGSFKEGIFAPLGPPGQAEFGDAFAGQSFANMPFGRRVQMAWLGHSESKSCREIFKDEPFSGQTTLPAELSLAVFPEGLVLRRQPAREFMLLRQPQILLNATNQSMKQKGLLRVLSPPAAGTGLELHLRVTQPNSEFIRFKLSIAGKEVLVEANSVSKKLNFVTGALKKEQTIQTSHWAMAQKRRMPLRLDAAGSLELRIFTDRHSVEVFDVHGGASMSVCAPISCTGRTGKWDRDVYVSVEVGKPVLVQFLRVYELKPSVGDAAHDTIAPQSVSDDA